MHQKLGQLRSRAMDSVID